jgi:antitoxin CptB
VTTDAAADLGRLRWRCRRGIRELDELLVRYVDERYGAAPAAEQCAFERLLDTEDTVIYEYCLGRIHPPCAEVAALIERITSRT